MKPSHCLECGSLISQSSRGQPRKFCSDAHKKAFQRNPHEPAKPSSTPTTSPSEQSQTTAQQTLTPKTINPRILNPWAFYPPNIAPYMPQTTDLEIARLIKSTPLNDADCKF